MDNILAGKSYIDTKDEGTEYCAIRGGKGGKYKWPNLLELHEKFNAPRRTEILNLGAGLEDIDLIANERSVVLLTETGYLKRMPVNEFEATSRGTRGKAGTRSQSEEEVKLFITKLYFR